MQVAETGLETTLKTPGKTGVLEVGGAHSGAFASVLHQIAAELRTEFTPEQCTQLASLLTRPDDG